MFLRSFQTYLWIIPLFLILSCSDYENPFKSPAYSKAHIKDCGIPDTLSLFDTREVSIGVHVSEFVDSFRVTCPGNRFFSGGDSTLRIETRTDEDLHFEVSMTDTGTSVFRVESYLTNGEIRDTSISFYVYSQFDIGKIQSFFDNKALGEPIVVELEHTVPDKDAVYNWFFGGSQNYKKTEPLCTLLVNTKTDSGVFFLSDNSGAESVRFCFPIGISDTEAPAVILMNSMVSEQGDTVFAGSDDFNFYVRIIDNSVEPLNKVRINGSEFDSVLQSKTYLKIFNNLSRDNDSTTEIEVYAEDASGNTTVKNLVLFYNPDGVSVKDDKAYFLVNYPNDSVVYTSSSSIPFLGEVGNLSDDTVRFVTEVNGEVDTSITLNPGSGVDTWLNRAEIDTEGSIFSNVYLYLLNNTRDTVASESYNILYHKDLSDTIPPVIMDVRVSDSVSAEGYVTSDSVVELSVLAFDEGSGIKEIKVFSSDTSQFMYSREERYLYTEVFDISHIKEGNFFNFIAMDNAGFADTQRVVIYMNSPPELEKNVIPPEVLYTNMVWTDNLKFKDTDEGDVLHLTDTSDIPEGFVFDRMSSTRWEITYSPKTADTGWNRIRFFVNDGYGGEEAVELDVFVADSGSLKGSAFKRDASSYIPDFIDYNDTLFIPDIYRVIDSSVGTQPYTIELSSGAGVTQPYLHGPDNKADLLWEPEVSDTGMQRLNISVTDSNNITSTLVQMVYISGRNHGFTLSTELSSGIQFDDTADYTYKSVFQDTLSLIISDTNRSIGEHHYVSLDMPGASVDSSLVQDSVYNVIFTIDESDTGYSDLYFKVEDRRGYSKEIKRTLFFGYPPEGVTLITPQDSSVVLSEPRAFKWSISDSGTHSDISNNFYLYDSSGTLMESILGIDSLPEYKPPVDTGWYQWRIEVFSNSGRFKETSAFSGFMVDDSSGYSRQISIDTSYSVDGNIHDVPVLIRVSDTLFGESPMPASDSICVVKTDGTPVPFHIESWDKSLGTGRVWALMDTICSDSLYTAMELRWNTFYNDERPSGSSVFNGYSGVWHLNDQVTHLNSDYVDVSGNMRHGTGSYDSLRGLRAYYFNSFDLDESTFAGDSIVRYFDLSWADGEAPKEGENTQEYSISFNGHIFVEQSGTYTFYVDSCNNGMRLYIGDSLVHDLWNDIDINGSYKEEIELNADELIPVTIEYYNHLGSGKLKIEWSGPDKEREILSFKNLFSDSVLSCFPEAVEGVIGMSQDFDTLDRFYGEYIEFPLTSMTKDSLRISFWINPEPDPNRRSCIFSETSDNSGFRGTIESDNSVGFEIFHSDIAGEDTTGVFSSPLTQGEWHYIVCEYKSGALYLYVNGEEPFVAECSQELAESAVSFYTGVNRGNGFDDTYAFYGRLDELWVSGKPEAKDFHKFCYMNQSPDIPVLRFE